jgi:hypothetical protein
MIGLSEADVRMCAGFPTATAEAGGLGQIWTYQRTVQRGNLNIVVPTLAVGAVPAVGGSLNVAPGGYCNTQIRMVAGHVVEVAYAGDNNQPNNRDALCVSTVDACVAYARQRHQSRTGAIIGHAAGSARSTTTPWNPPPVDSADSIWRASAFMACICLRLVIPPGQGCGVYHFNTIPNW